MQNLGMIEKKVLGALIIHMDENSISNVTNRDIANTMGYKEPGGAITFALKVLERDNLVLKLEEKQKYKVLV